VPDIVIGYDGSACGKAALGVAIEIARQFGDRVVIAYAYAPPQLSRGEEYRAHRAALEEIGEHATAEALSQARAGGVDAEVVLVENKPAQALLGLSTSRDTRMIVVGTHGEGPLTSALLGSVPHKLLQRTTVPVLVVPAEAS
jgi:nucleotide-binding universal stress UspA family protein